MIEFNRKLYETINTLLDEGFSENQIINFLIERKKQHRPKLTPNQKKKFDKVMNEFYKKELKSHNIVVKNVDQALAIAYSEAGSSK